MTKLKSDGCLEKYKAIFISKEYTQFEGIDYLETFSILIKIQTIRLVLSLALLLGWDLKQLEVKNAF